MSSRFKKKELETFNSFSAHHRVHKLCLFLQQGDVSGNSSSQQEFSVFFPAQHSVHFEGVRRSVGEGHHVFAEFLERTLGHQLHPHRSDAAFDPKGLVDSRVLLKANVQLDR